MNQPIHNPRGILRNGSDRAKPASKYGEFTPDVSYWDRGPQNGSEKDPIDDVNVNDFPLSVTQVFLVLEIDYQPPWVNQAVDSTTAAAQAAYDSEIAQIIFSRETLSAATSGALKGVINRRLQMNMSTGQAAYSEAPSSKDTRAMNEGAWKGAQKHLGAKWAKSQSKVALQKKVEDCYDALVGSSEIGLWIKDNYKLALAGAALVTIGPYVYLLFRERRDGAFGTPLANFIKDKDKNIDVSGMFDDIYTIGRLKEKDQQGSKVTLGVNRFKVEPSDQKWSVDTLVKADWKCVNGFSGTLQFDVKVGDFVLPQVGAKAEVQYRKDRVTGKLGGGVAADQSNLYVGLDYQINETWSIWIQHEWKNANGEFRREAVAGATLHKLGF